MDVDVARGLLVECDLSVPYLDDEGGEALAEEDGGSGERAHSQEALEQLGLLGLEVGNDAALARGEVGEGGGDAAG